MSNYDLNTMFLDWTCMYLGSMQYTSSAKRVYVTFPTKTREGNLTRFKLDGRGTAAMIYHAATSDLFGEVDAVFLRKIYMGDILLAQITVDRQSKEVVLFFDTLSTTAAVRYAVRKELLEHLVITGWATYISFDGADHRSLTGTEDVPTVGLTSVDQGVIN